MEMLTKQTYGIYLFLAGSYSCTCPTGFALSSGVCADVNECAAVNQCEHDCVNTNGSYECTCR